jgi:DNA-binding CsgD family transcriptional regulator
MADDETDNLAEALADAPVLTPRQAEVYARRMRGESNTEIADELGLGGEDDGARAVSQYMSDARKRLRQAEELLELVELLEDPSEDYHAEAVENRVL